MQRVENRSTSYIDSPFTVLDKNVKAVIQEGITSHISQNFDRITSLEEGMSNLEKYGRLLLLQSFQEQIGVFRNENEEFEINRLKEKIKIIPKYERLYNALLDMMQREGWVEIKDDLIVTTALVNNTSQQINSLKELLIPELQPFQNLLELVVVAYPQVLSGETTHFDILFPNGTGEIYDQVFKGNPLSDFYNRLVTIATTTYVKELQKKYPGRTINIIEVGAGIGGTSEMVLEALKTFSNLNYYYTDISLSFTNYGKKKYGPLYSFVKFKPYDIEKEPSLQGFEQQSFDIVIETNAIHATRNLDESIRSIKSLLKIDGMLVINEISQVQDFWMLASGIIDGWWLFEDPEKRMKHSPLLNYSQWRNLFIEHGFHSITEAEPNRKKKYEQAVICAYSNGLIGDEMTKKANSLNKRGKNVVQETIRQLTEEILGESCQSIDAGFFDLGLNSLQLLDLQEGLEEKFKITLSSTVVLDYPSIRVLADYIEGQLKSEPKKKMQELTEETKASKKKSTSNKQSNTSENNHTGDIAIVGMACRFPGKSDTPEAFWELLINSIDPVDEIPKERWEYDHLANATITTRMGGYLQNVDQFDNLFFKISAKEAEVMDPQHRLLLELTWEAIEDAGWNPKSLKNSNTGVFVGISGSDYIQVGRDLGHQPGAYTLTGNMNNGAAGRISYAFGLQGPSLAIDAACSSSLAAVQQGMMQLQTGDCNVALAAGVNLILRAEGHACFSSLQSLSPTGRCRSFDDAADGYIRSEGGAVLVLKRLEDAKKDGDKIWGVLRGAASNHGGHNGGFTMPNGVAQQNAIKRALNKAGLNPEDIDYIEAHGSATKIGDPQEVNALAEVFGSRERPLYLGSVKSNIGHLEIAAGIAGLCKVLLSMHHGRIPANLHFEKGNKLIPWDSYPFEVVTQPKEWKPRNGVRRAGITSIGINGTNTHIIVESPPKVETQVEASDGKSHHLFTLSARTENALMNFAKEMLTWSETTTASVADLCRITNLSRTAMDRRLAFPVDNMASLREGIMKIINSGKEIGTSAQSERKPLVFLFTGQGSLYQNMAKGLYEHSLVFRKKFDELDLSFKSRLGVSMVELVYGSKTFDLNRPLFSQPLLYTLQVSLAHFWQSIGLVPDIIIGHSIGEYAAAYLDGVISLEDGIQMVATRAEIMDQTPENGRMVTVFASENTVSELIKEYPDVSIAAVNSTENTTISGGNDSINQLIATIRKKRIFVEEIGVLRPFHSVLMEEGALLLEKSIEDVSFQEPTDRLISSVTGRFAVDDTTIDSSYWSKHLIQPVRFMDAIESAILAGGSVFLEIGATATLSGLAAQILNEDKLTLPSLRNNRSDWSQIYETLGRLWMEGYEVDFHSLHENKKQVHIDYLPHTPYERKKVWFENKVANVNSMPTQSIQVFNNEPFRYKEVEESSNSVIEWEVILDDIKNMVIQVTGVADDDIHDNVNLFSLGMDSLMMVQLRRQVSTKFGVDIPTNTFYIELHTVKAIAQYIENVLAKERKFNLDQNTASSIVEESHNTNMISDSTSTIGELETIKPITHQATGLEMIIDRQLKIMEDQLSVMKQSMNPNSYNEDQVAATALVDKQEKKEKKIKKKSIIKQMDSQPIYALTDQQLQFIKQFSSRWTTRTKASKEYATKYRNVLADWIANLNFEPSLKEMVYPIVTEKACGSRIWDIDGNEYVDATMGYGAAFFGHNPNFVKEAIRSQIEKGMELGPQSALPGKVAELIKELTGVERVAFSNTGTEAVMAAIRIARAVSGRDKIVRFANSFHGTFDGILAEADGEASQPTSLGTPISMVEDTIVLNYGSKDSLESIRHNGNQLAAILVEPIQSRNPGFHPGEYLQELREICSEYEIALIFDEMVTGFRIHPGGAQAYFGVSADIVTYGKVVAGGTPIGIIAGKSKYLNAIDGGSWDFEDNSQPDTPTATFGGTFCKHPIAMAASIAVLNKIKAEGMDLINKANFFTEQFAQKANAYFREENVPLRAAHCASIFRFQPGVSTDMSMLSFELNLFYRLMMEAGVYIWERRTCTFSVEHGLKEMEKILQAIRYSVETLRKGGFKFQAVSNPDPSPLNKGNNTTDNNLKEFSLSSEEKRVYIMSTLEGGNQAYQIRCKYMLDGEVDFQRLRSAFQVISDTHEMLRSTFRFEGTKIIHEVKSKVEPEHYFFDFRIKGENEEFQTFWERIFDLKEGPLWRWALVIDKNGKHYLYLSIHHIIADGGSLNIIFQDLESIFKGDNVRKPTLSYREFVKMDEDYLSSDKSKEQKEWWMNKFNPIPSALQLPTVAARPSVNQFKGDVSYFTIDSEELDKVKSLARSTKTTPFMVLLAAWTAFLGKIANQDDFCVGVPWDRRNIGDFERTVGMFAQTLLIRAKPSFTRTCKDYLENIKEQCLGAYSHADYPLDALLENLKVERNMSRNPLFDVMFNYENEEKRIINLGKVHAKLEEYATKYSQFDLFLEMLERNGQLYCSIIFALPMFQKEIIEEWILSFKTFLHELVTNSDKKISEINLLNPEQHKQLMQIGQGPNISLDNQTATSLLEGAMKNYKHKPAIWFQGKELDFDTLDRRAQVIASRLKDAGINAGDRIGIILKRSPDLIASLLATLKIGCTYVPIDVDFPKKRIDYILESSKINFLICESNYYSMQTFSTPFLDPAKIKSQKSTIKSLDYKGTTTDIAYIMYTSGSTGSPKGVQVEQGSLANFMIGMKDALEWRIGTRTASFTTVSFDIFILETLFCLVHGGCIVLAEEGEGANPERIAEVVKAGKVDCLQMTPTRLKLLGTNAQAMSKVLSSIQLLVVGGEAFPKHLLPLLQEYPSLRVFNVYGPTETCIWSTVKELTSANVINIGLPISNTSVYVLNHEKQLLPPGCIGDLWIGGLGVARGYLNNPSSSSESFIEDPFLGGIMYKTGDQAKWIDGELVLLGRKDDQVKLRGYRIELSEIEQILRENPSIQEAATTVWGTSPDNRLLVAYIVLKPGTEFIEEQLRSWLSEQLPEYMIPAIITDIPSIPKTENGKLDKKNLPNPIIDSVHDHTDKEKSLDDLELTILNIWKQVLGNRPIGLHDSFFDVGGNSFNLVLMHEELERQFPRIISVTDLFVYHTISRLSHFIKGKNNANSNLKSGLELTDNWFDVQNKKGGNLEIDIDPELANKINRFGSVFGLDISQTLCGFYSIYLYKVLNSKTIPFYYISNFEQINALEFNFNDEIDIGKFFRSIPNYIHLNQNNLNIDELDSHSKLERGIRIGLGNGRGVNRSKLSGYFDFTLLLEGNNENLSITLNYRRGFSTQYLIDHMKHFLSFLNDIVNKMLMNTVSN